MVPSCHVHDRYHGRLNIRPSHLDETNVSGLLTEALAADVEPILADDTVVVAADAAVW